ncbi:MAG: glycosyl transferase [Phycisphaerae bacterium]
MSVAAQPAFCLPKGELRAEPTGRGLVDAGVLSVTCAYNEAGKLSRVLQRLACVEGIDALIVDDASTDSTPDLIREHQVATVRHERRRGVGAAIRTAIGYFLERDYQIMVLVAGNDKDRPDEIARIVAPILAGESDLVQGSRHLPGGCAGNTPLYRRVATRYVHPLLFSLVSGQRMTDTTNGFRAIHRRVFEALWSDLQQSWLDAYELEVYLLYRAIRSGFRVTEVPVSKIYPPRSLGYTKMKPISGWWSILRPMLLLGLGIRR